MSKVTLSMTVERLPNAMGVPVEHRGLLMARICVSDRARGDDVTLLADRADKFDHTDVAAMLRVFAAKIEQKYNDQKDAA